MQQINIHNGPQNASAIILGCMRMPALSVDAAADMIRTAWEEGVNFFSQGNVNIVAPGMSHITVMNALGQMVYDANAAGNMTSLDMSQYQAGIYMVRVTTENGESMKRISIVK